MRYSVNSRLSPRGTNQVLSLEHQGNEAEAEHFLRDFVASDTGMAPAQPSLPASQRKARPVAIGSLGSRPRSDARNKCA